MGQNKLALEYQGKSLLQHTFDLVLSLPFYERILLISPENASGITIPVGIKVIQNDDPKRGQAYSVFLGTRAAGGLSYMYFTGDQPLLTVALLESMMAASTEHNIVYPIKEDGSPSSPTCFGKAFRQELLAVTKENKKGGGRVIRDRYPEFCVKIRVQGQAQLFDIDTPEKYQQLQEMEKDI
ncbi:MAG: NTP transferase domain-containing protein [Lachnospiraceae bacterium]|nr:NTP transferase domain-containing protein [Lachnospiraceae bacterium]